MRKRLVSGSGFEKMRELQVGTYKPYPMRFPLHLSGHVLIDTRIWWVSGVHGNSP